MIGLIVTGHGEFATGLTSSLTLIGGEQEDYCAIDFTQEMGVGDLEQKIQDGYTALSTCEGIIVLSDLAGGSPFKTAVLCGQLNDKVHVIAGTNLPMLIELAMARKFITDIEQLVDMGLSTGKAQIVKFENKIAETIENEEGI